MANAELFEVGSYPEIYADDLAEGQLLTGGNVRLILFTWRKIEGIYRKTIAGMVIRPFATLPHPEDVTNAAERAKQLVPPDAKVLRH